jgi:hypothetical protein
MSFAAVLVVAVEASAFVAPMGWTRWQIDATHTTIVPRIRTVEAWMPYARTPAHDALYYAAGDGSGVTLDVFVAETKAALPRDAVVSTDKPVVLCDGQKGRYIAFATPTLIVEEIVAVGGDVSAAARYERAAGTLENADARRSIDALCPQAEAPPSE